MIAEPANGRFGKTTIVPPNAKKKKATPVPQKRGGAEARTNNDKLQVAFILFFSQNVKLFAPEIAQ